jgi:hypothetical protein
MSPRTFVAVLIALFVPNALFAASTTTYQYDQYSEDLTTALSQIGGAHLSAQPGFAQGEAFGQLFRPAPDDYPIRIEGLDLILAGPASGGVTSADIEIWLDAGEGPTPNKAAPDFTINTVDLLNAQTGEFDINLAGNMANRLDFDYEATDSHPPFVYSGNILVLIRYSEPAQDLSEAWDNLACSTLIGCGCQAAAPFEDENMTSGVNILNTYAFGLCEEPNASQWNFAETVGLGGDFIIRLRAETSNTSDPGDTGTTEDDSDPSDPEAGLTISALSPASASNDAPTQVSIVGNGFAEGAAATLGATALENVTVTGTQLITAAVPAGMIPGTYMLVVINPDETSTFLLDAFEVQSGTAGDGDNSEEEGNPPEDSTEDETQDPETTGETDDSLSTGEPDSTGQPESGGCASTHPQMFGFLWLMLGLIRRTLKPKTQSSLQ